jgi:energy-coupling factor transport system ATP-binding protein
MEEAARADRIVVMNDGEVLLDGTPREVFHRAELLRSVGLTVPQGTELLLRLARHGYSLNTDALTPSECAAEIVRLFENLSGKENASNAN